MRESKDATPVIGVSVVTPDGLRLRITSSVKWSVSFRHQLSDGDRQSTRGVNFPQPHEVRAYLAPYMTNAQCRVCALGLHYFLQQDLLEDGLFSNVREANEQAAAAVAALRDDQRPKKRERVLIAWAVYTTLRSIRHSYSI